MDESAARAKIFEIGFSWTVPRALFVAAELGVADVLGDGPESVERIAAKTGAHAPSLERVLRLLVKHQVFDQDELGRFHNNAVSKLISSDVPGSLRDFVRFDNAVLWAAYGDLLHAVKTGEPGFDHAHGKDFFAYLTSDMEGAVRVDSAQRSLSVAEDRVIARAFDFSGVRSVCDLGGGRGGLLTEILLAFPEVQGVLCDQPQVVERPERLEQANLLDRCTVVAGDFFDSVPAGHEIYVLKRVIHDWDDEKSLRILRNVHRAMGPDARLLVIEGIVRKGDTGSLVRECDIAIMTFLRGRIRSAGEFEDLFSSAGFQMHDVVGATSLVSIMELSKA